MHCSILKKVISVVSIVILLITACGCSAQKSYDLNEISEAIVGTTEFSELKELSGTTLTSYFGFQDSDVKRFNVKVSATAESADTVACFEVNDKAGQEKVVSGISNYLTGRATSFKATMESEYNKVQSRLLVQVDNVIILVVCSDYAPVTEYLNDLGAKEVI
ncbi:MAG: DUF4358 domain-containing protein [Clostridia bacterium]|nr:DUF4358 domain-containing protein [Clostridia bacterium]